jgi:chromosomal replication initiation ATPase DnaA
MIEQASERVSVETELEKRGLLGLARECAYAHSVTVDDIFSRRRFRPMCQARALLCAALRCRGWSYPAIGLVMHLDHTTVIYAAKSVPSDDVVMVERSAKQTTLSEAIMAARL